MDHMRFLGNTISAIAFEKAGILKPSVIIGHGTAAMEIIENGANEIGALYKARLEWNLTDDFSGLHLSHRENTRPTLSWITGNASIPNAGQAVVQFETIGSHIERDTIATGLKTTEWPGRLQKLDEGNLVSLIQSWELWIDGGHNQAAGSYFRLCEVWNSPLVLIFGALNSGSPRLS